MEGLFDAMDPGFDRAAVGEYQRACRTGQGHPALESHYRDDLHQDHRLISELAWNSFRDHMILEYEIPKYDGDMGSPNSFVHLAESTAHKKIANILECFRSQRTKHWFDDQTFLSMLRLRGMESNAPDRYAEAFYSRKTVIA